MTDTVETFRRIASLILRWFLWALLGTIALIAVVSGIYVAYSWYTYDRHVANVEFIISTDRKCPDDKWPIQVLIGNNSSKVVEKSTFRLSARLEGRSTDLAKYHSYEDDHILAPEMRFSRCWAVPELAQKVTDPRTLGWSIAYKSIAFQ